MTQEHEPTEHQREIVQSYSAVGITQEDIARVLDIDAKTLRKHYRDELDTAAVKANAAVAGTLFNKAKAGDTAAMIWWTKSRMRWTEKQEIEVDGDLREMMVSARSRNSETKTDD